MIYLKNTFKNTIYFIILVYPYSTSNRLTQSFWSVSQQQEEMTAEITKEQAEKVISEEANDDEFKDAVQEADDVDGNFPVTAEEMSIIRAELACEFPEDYSYLSDAYVMSVASKPYSKDPTVRRPMEVRIQNKRLSSWQQFRPGWTTE